MLFDDFAYFYCGIHLKTSGFIRLWMKGVDFSLVLLGCGWKVLIFHWFYRVVDEKCWFYVGFTRLWMQTVGFYSGCGWQWWFFIGFYVKFHRQRIHNPGLRFGASRRRRSRSSTFASEQPQQQNLITQLRLASPARTHERNETISRLGSQGLTPPTSNLMRIRIVFDMLCEF